MNASKMEILSELAQQGYTLTQARQLLAEADYEGTAQTGGFWLEATEGGYVLTSKVHGYQWGATSS